MQHFLCESSPHYESLFSFCAKTAVDACLCLGAAESLNVMLSALASRGCHHAFTSHLSLPQPTFSLLIPTQLQLLT